MKATLKYWILFAGLFLTTLPLMAEDYWQRAVVNYTRQQYHSGNQNWQIAQSREGWMYFANNKGLLEFDGSMWHTYTLPGNAKVRSVYADGRTIYIVGINFSTKTRRINDWATKKAE